MFLPPVVCPWVELAPGIYHLLQQVRGKIPKFAFAQGQKCSVADFLPPLQLLWSGGFSWPSRVAFGGLARESISRMGGCGGKKVFTQDPYLGISIYHSFFCVHIFNDPCKIPPLFTQSNSLWVHSLRSCVLMYWKGGLHYPRALGKTEEREMFLISRTKQICEVN